MCAEIICPGSGRCGIFCNSGSCSRSRKHVPQWPSRFGAGTENISRSGRLPLGEGAPSTGGEGALPSREVAAGLSRHRRWRRADPRPDRGGQFGTPSPSRSEPNEPADDADFAKSIPFPTEVGQFSVDAVTAAGVPSRLIPYNRSVEHLKAVAAATAVQGGLRPQAMKAPQAPWSATAEPPLCLGIGKNWTGLDASTMPARLNSC